MHRADAEMLHLLLLNHVPRPTVRRVVCPCVGAELRDRLWTTASMRYHAPHIHNLVDVQQLAELVEAQLKVFRASAVTRTSTPIPREDVMLLAEPLTQSCCCEAPSELSWHSQDISTGGFSFSNLSMWARLCRIQEGQGEARMSRQ